MSNISNVNYNWYRTFLAVALANSYVEGSKELHVSVPAVSLTIQKLEKTLGVKLFEQKNGKNDGAKLTREGKKLLEVVKNAVDLFELGEKIIADSNNLENGEIIIGCPSHIASFILIDAIKKAQKDYPNLKIKITGCANSNEMLQLLKEHTLDFIIDVIETEDRNVVTEKLTEIDNIFISNIPIQINKIEELEKYKYILNFDYTMTSRKLMQKLQEYNVKIQDIIELDITEMRIRAAKEGLGIGYVMKNTVKNELEKEEIYEIKLPVELPKSTINLIYLKDYLSKSSKKFIKQYIKK